MKTETTLWAIIVLIALTLSFFAGKSVGTCAETPGQTVTVLDTVITYVEKKAEWKPGANTKIDKSVKTILSKVDSVYIVDTVTVIVYRDSINVQGAGLKFEHLITNGDLVQSDYKVVCPEIRLTQVTTTTRVKERKQAVGAGVHTSITNSINQPAQLDAGLLLSYRFDKLNIQAGYTLSNRAIINIVREF